MKEIIEYRIKLLDKCKKSDELQAIELTCCKNDILYWFKNYVYTDRNPHLY